VEKARPHWRQNIRRLKYYRSHYILILPAFIATAVFGYWPMYGILLAFKNFKLSQGIIGSPWASDFGFRWFILIFRDPKILNVIQNTVVISVTKILLATVVCVGLALLLNELRSARYRRVLQTMMYMPHFLSWIVMAGVIYSILTINGGLVNRILVDLFGIGPVQFLSKPQFFRPIVYISQIWKDAGFGTVIYIAAIAGVRQELYESAIIDGAGRFDRIRYITLPSIQGTILIVLVLSVSNVMSAGFDQIFNLYSPSVLQVGDILDTFVYRRGILGGEYSFATAIDLFKTLVSVILLLIVNRIARKLSDVSLF
jgi:putative aldouronate transport system permease protein